MYNSILSDSLSIPQTEFYYLANLSYRKAVKFVLDTKNDNNLNKIKTLIIYNKKFFPKIYLKPNTEKVLAVLEKKFDKIKKNARVNGGGKFWAAISAAGMSTNFLRKYSEKICWSAVSYCELSEDFIREFQNKVDWYYISFYKTLSKEFIREFQNKVDWGNISFNQRLSEDFIREFKDKVNWHWISSYQKLSEDFIREFQDKVDWNYISEYQTLSKEFKKEFKHLMVHK